MKSLKKLVKKAYKQSMYNSNVCIKAFCENEGFLYKVEIREASNSSKIVLVTCYLYGDENCLYGELIDIHIVKSFFSNFLFDNDLEDSVVNIYGTEEELVNIVGIDVTVIQNALTECITKLYWRKKWHDDDAEETFINKEIRKDE